MVGSGDGALVSPGLNGIKDGRNVGRFVGGEVVGLSVRNRVGPFVWVFVGEMVGRCVGIHVGLGEGSCVGLEVDGALV